MEVLRHSMGRVVAPHRVSHGKGGSAVAENTTITYTATFRHRHGGPEECAAVKRFLKRCLRAGGLECIDVSEIPATVDVSPVEKVSDK
jgi:hypothetical protein